MVVAVVVAARMREAPARAPPPPHAASPPRSLLRTLREPSHSSQLSARSVAVLVASLAIPAIFPRYRSARSQYVPGATLAALTFFPPAKQIV